MRRSPGLVAVALLLTSCGTFVPERACTLIGTVPGVQLVVAKDIAAQVSGVRLKVCWAARCQERTVDLRPGSVSGDQGCDSASPGAVCSASASPDQTLTGFVQIADLPDGAVTVSATGLRERRWTRWQAVTVATRRSYPNGPDCGAGAPAASVRLDATGLH